MNYVRTMKVIKVVSSLQIYTCTFEIRRGSFISESLINNAVINGSLHDKTTLSNVKYFNLHSNTTLNNAINNPNYHNNTLNNAVNNVSLHVSRR